MNECHSRLEKIEEEISTRGDRLESIERQMSELRKDIISIMAIQTTAVEAIKAAADEQKEVLRNEAKSLNDQLLKQASDMQGVSTAMISLQRTISKYAAAGTLACSVLLYILAKAAGL